MFFPIVFRFDRCSVHSFLRRIRICHQNGRIPKFRIFLFWKNRLFSKKSKKNHKILSFGSRSPLSDCFDALERWAISKSSGYVESQLILWGPRYCFSPDNGRPGGGPRGPSRGMTFADCCHWRRRRRRRRRGRRSRRRSPDFSLKSNNPNLKAGEIQKYSKNQVARMPRLIITYIYIYM